MVLSIDDVYEIPHVIINLAHAKMHVPLTLLTAEAMERIHTDPSCVKMKKGILLDDPKRLIMDSSSSLLRLHFLLCNLMRLLKILSTY
jgi:hypothetical protein